LLVEELRQLAHSPGTPAERIQRMLVFRILFLFDRAQERAHALDDMYIALRPQYKAYRDRYVNSEAEVFAEVLREGHQSGAFELEDPFEVAHAFIFATSTLTPFSLSVRELGEREWVERRIRLIAALLIHGIVRNNANASA